MSVQRSRLAAMSLGATLLASLVLTGCHARCAGRCTPKGPWESPTIQATRALLLVNTPELNILRINGKNVGPSCVGADGVREYYLPPGTHSITASFRYQAPVSAGLIGAVEGKPITLKHHFVAGREYVAVYHEHPTEKPQAENLVQAIALTFGPTPDCYWSLEIVDLADATADAGDHVQKARLYTSLIRAQRDRPGTY